MRLTLSILSMVFGLLLIACQNKPPTPTPTITPSPFPSSTPTITPTPIPPTPTYMPPRTDTTFPVSRDIYKWPFAHDSIWNMPIGSGAVYVQVKIQPAGGFGMTVDEDIIILKPDAPLMDVYYNYEGWSRRNRCVIQGDRVGQFPIPPGFFVPHLDGTTPNNSTAILMPDGRTIKQNQPFHHCPGQDYGVTQYLFPDVDIYGDGTPGAHGASGLSSIGGTIRLGELVPGSFIRHALKVNLFCRVNCYYDPTENTPGYRWPAFSADNYAGDPDNPIRYLGRNPVLQIGALLTLHPSVNLNSLAENSLGLETEPALILARTFQDYGAYLVDDTAWDVYAILVERSPDGNVVDEFEKVWGFTITPPSTMTPWSRDMQRIFTNLYVVDNNEPDSVGGGGTLRQPLAPTVSPDAPVTSVISVRSSP